MYQTYESNQKEVAKHAIVKIVCPTRVFNNAYETAVVLMVLKWHRWCTFRMPKHALNNAYGTAVILPFVFSTCLANIFVRIALLQTVR